MAVTKVSEVWRNRKAQERSDLEAGKISKEECIMEQLFPDAFIERADKVMGDFADSISRCPTFVDGYPDVMKHVAVVVCALNEINNDLGGSVIETSEREELCEYVDAVLLDHGIDIAALAAWQKCEPDELTDLWREW